MNNLGHHFDRFMTLLVAGLNRGAVLVRQLISKRIHFSAKEKIIFLKRLSMMLRAGIPIRVCLEMLEQESSKQSRSGQG